MPRSVSGKAAFEVNASVTVSTPGDSTVVEPKFSLGSVARTPVLINRTATIANRSRYFMINCLDRNPGDRWPDKTRIGPDINLDEPETTNNQVIDPYDMLTGIDPSDEFLVFATTHPFAPR
jgi:hypothetical protein